VDSVTFVAQYLMYVIVQKFRFSEIFERSLLYAHKGYIMKKKILWNI